MSLQDYTQQNILAWLSYNPNYKEFTGEPNKVCYIYPQILLTNNLYKSIDKKEFPTRGSIEIRIQNGESVEDLLERVDTKFQTGQPNSLGALVTMRINEISSYPNENSQNYYNLKYSYLFGRDKSEIWVEQFSGKFYQLIDIEQDISLLQKEKSLQLSNIKIYTTYILLRYENKFYGPFQYELKDDVLKLTSCKEYQYIIGSYDVTVYQNNYLQIKDGNDTLAITLLPKDSLQDPIKCEQYYDWIEQEKLIEGFIEALRTEETHPKEEIRQLKDNIFKLIKNKSDIYFSEERINQLKKLLEEISEKETSFQEIIEYIFNNEQLEKKLMDELTQKYFNLISDKLPEYESVQNEIVTLKQEKNKILDEIKELNNSNQRNNIIPSNYQEEITQLHTVNDNLTQQVNELQNKLSKINNYEEELKQLQNSCTEYKAKNDDLRKKHEIETAIYDAKIQEKGRLEEKLKKIIDDFKDPTQTTASLLENQLLNNLLRSIESEVNKEPQFEKFNPGLLSTNIMNSTELIERITSFIRDKAHRDVTFNDIANYLICITQGFITTFAGEPGTGKTSLCNILAKSLGLVTNDTQKRFIDISVERGWSSHKDFIGYYNPLSKNMEKSNIEVFNAFEKMDAEDKEYKNNTLETKPQFAPFIILLDEANLSPLEHYWAPFLKSCDGTSSSNKTISLGGNNSFNLPEHLRFLATVNFDHTTEELSPRFLDRAWVIMLEPTRIDEDIDEEIDNAANMISFENLKDIFSANVSDINKIDDAINDKWNLIQKIFKDNSLQIMPRNLKRVKNYCAVACRCMERNSPSTSLAPLDYAFSQKILPTINGHGEQYSKLIEDLKNICMSQNMPLSAKHLERMSQAGENNMKFFNFFSH